MGTLPALLSQGQVGGETQYAACRARLEMKREHLLQRRT